MPPADAKAFSGIFISYHRDDSSGHAGRLFDRLSEHFGEPQIFMDVEGGTQAGEDFVEAIVNGVGSCEILIAIIGRRWLLNAEGSRRLDNPNDFVRLEIATAFKRDVRVVPVLVDGAVMPQAPDLPSDLAKFSRLHATKLSHERFRRDVDDFIGDLGRILVQREEARRRAAQVPHEKGKISEINPYRKTARTLAFLFYCVAALILVAGVFFTIAAASMDTSQLQLEGIANQRMAVMVASPFLIISLIIILLGWRVQSLFGQQRRKDKLAAKFAVGCLRIGSLGCALWAMASAASILITGKIMATGEPAGLRELFIDESGFILLIILMLAVAWFISANFASLNPEERKRAYAAYKEAIRPYLTKLAEPKARTNVQEQTMEVLEKLDTSLKSALLVFLSQSGLLGGDMRLALQDANFRRGDLSSTNLPRADLHGINLEAAILRDAGLFKANLQKAKLKNADLSGANLQEADLREADLTGAVLEGTNLTDANLMGTNLSPEQRHQIGPERNDWA